MKQSAKFQWESPDLIRHACGVLSFVSSIIRPIFGKHSSRVLQSTKRNWTRSRQNSQKCTVDNQRSIFHPLEKVMTSEAATTGVNQSTDGLTILEKILKDYGRPEVVKIRDAAKVEKLLGTIADGGSRSLQVISDFDRTLSRDHLNGEKCAALAGILRRSPKMPQECRDQMTALYIKYYPIEVSHSLPEEEKIPLMVEWFQKILALVVETGFNKEFFQQIVQDSKCILRDNAIETLKILHENDIPLLIFSAGLGDLLEAVLQENKICYPNVKIVANYMEFDQRTGRINGFKPPLIHTNNKHESCLFEGDTYFMDLAHRGNALVIGDNIGDAKMSDGMKNPVAIVKIGFLNDRIDERLDSFMDTWDIVLCDDQSMDFVNLLLKHVLRQNYRQ